MLLNKTTTHIKRTHPLLLNHHPHTRVSTISQERDMTRIMPNEGMGCSSNWELVLGFLGTVPELWKTDSS